MLVPIPIFPATSSFFLPPSLPILNAAPADCNIQKIIFPVPFALPHLQKHHASPFRDSRFMLSSSESTSCCLSREYLDVLSYSFSITLVFCVPISICSNRGRIFVYLLILSALQSSKIDRIGKGNYFSLPLYRSFNHVRMYVLHFCSTLSTRDAPTSYTINGH